MSSFKSKPSAWVVFAFSLFMGAAGVTGALGGARAAEPSKPVFQESGIQLVQSVPAEVDFAQPGVPQTAQAWIEMIQGAKSTLDLAQFYVSSGETPQTKKKPLQPILDEMDKAAKRGVKIRFLVSSSLIQEDPITLDRIKNMRGAQVRVLDMSEGYGGVHHAKYWIVDQKEVFVGSQNLDWRALTQNYELGVRLLDAEIAKQLGRIFDNDWKLARKSSDAALGYYVSNPIRTKRFELVAGPQALNPSDIRPSIEALVELIDSAKNSIRIQLMDYAPLAGNQYYWPELDNAIRAAAIRGVKIQMLLANSPSTVRSIGYIKSLGVFPGVEIKLVTFPPYSGGHIPHARIAHAKSLVVDDQVLWIGNSNWSKGYFYNSRNVELILRKADIADTAKQIFQKVWGSMYAAPVSSY